MGRGQLGTSHPLPGPAGAVGLVAWHPLTARMQELGSEGLDRAAGSGFGVGASARVNASQYLPGFPTFPWRSGGGTWRSWVCTHPPSSSSAPTGHGCGPLRMQPGGVTSGSGNSPCSGPGDKSRLLLHPFPLSSSAPRPAGLCTLPRCWPLGTWLRTRTSIPGDMHHRVGEGEGRSAALLQGLLAAGRQDA